MIEGIYRINFHSTQDLGEGIIVASNGKINGGDKFCVYRGTYTSENGATKADVHVSLHNPAGVTVFGPQIKEFQLMLSGTATGENFQLISQIAEQPNLKMTLYGAKLSDLA